MFLCIIYSVTNLSMPNLMLWGEFSEFDSKFAGLSEMPEEAYL